MKLGASLILSVVVILLSCVSTYGAISPSTPIGFNNSYAFGNANVSYATNYFNGQADLSTAITARHFLNDGAVEITAPDPYSSRLGIKIAFSGNPVRGAFNLAPIEQELNVRFNSVVFDTYLRLSSYPDTEGYLMEGIGSVHVANFTVESAVADVERQVTPGNAFLSWLNWSVTWTGLIGSGSPADIEIAHRLADQDNAAVVPEPAAALLLASSLSLVIRRRRR